MTSEVTHPPKEFEQLRESPAEGVYVYGLYLVGQRATKSNQTRSEATLNLDPDYQP